MNTHEILAILDVVSEMQGREFTDAQVQLWSNAIEDLDFSLAMAAVAAITRESDDFITPSTVRQQANLIADQRIRDNAQRCRPPAGLEDDQYLVWLKTLRGALISGADLTQANVQACQAIGAAVPDTHSLVPVPAPALQRVAAASGAVVTVPVVQDEA